MKAVEEIDFTSCTGHPVKWRLNENVSDFQKRMLKSYADKGVKVIGQCGNIVEPCGDKKSPFLFMYREGQRLVAVKIGRKRVLQEVNSD